MLDARLRHAEAFWPRSPNVRSGLPVEPARAARGARASSCTDDGVPAEQVIDELVAGVDPGHRRERRPALLRLRHRAGAAGGAGRGLAGRGLGPERVHATSARPPPRSSRRSSRAGCSTLLGLPATASVGLRHRRADGQRDLPGGRRATPCSRAGWDVAEPGPDRRAAADGDRRRRRRTRRSSARCGCIGLGRDAAQLRRRSTTRARCDPDALRSSDAGPAIVCAQAGNVNTGAFDPLEPIADAVRAGAARGCTSTARSASGRRRRRAPRTLTRGLERADSWATDAHKWLNVPYDSGLAIVARPRRPPRARWASPPPTSSQSDAPPELRLHARGLPPRPRLRGLRRAALARPQRRSPTLVERCCDARRPLRRAAARRRRRDPQRRRAQPGARRRAPERDRAHPGGRHLLGSAAPSGTAATRCASRCPAGRRPTRTSSARRAAILSALSGSMEELEHGLAALVQATPWRRR